MSINNHVRSYICQHNLSPFQQSQHESGSLGLPQNREYHIDVLLGPSPTPSFWIKDLHKIEGVEPNKVFSTPGGNTGIPEVVSTQGSRSKSLSIHTKFPFDQCSDLSLRESENVLDSSLRHFVHSRASIAFTESLRISLRELRFPTRLHSKLVEERSSVIEKQSKQKDTMSPRVKPTSILVSPTCESKYRRHLLSYLNECFYNYLLGRVVVENPGTIFENTANYITNLFMQEFSVAGTKELCSEIIESLRSDKLGSLLPKLLEEAEQKYVEQGFDDFQDFVSENLNSSVNMESKRHNAEDPRLYGVFKKIWILNPHEILDFNLEFLFSYLSTPKERPYTSMSFDHKLLDDMEESAMKMNLVQFYYVCRRELKSNTNICSSSENLCTLRKSLRDAAKRCVASVDWSKRIMNAKTDTKERVRFCESAIQAPV